MNFRAHTQERRTMSRENGRVEKSYGIQRKFLKYFVLLLFCAFLPITFLIVGYAKQASASSVKEMYEYRTQKVFDSFQNYYERIDTDTGQLVLNTMIQKSLKNGKLKAEDKEALLTVLSYIGEHSDYYLYIDNKGTAYSQKNISIDEKDIEKYEWARVLENEYAKTKFSYGKDLLFGGEQKYLFASRYVRHLSYNYEPGILCLRLNLEDMDMVIGDFQEDFGYYLLLDQENDICYMKNRAGETMTDGEMDRVAKRIKALAEQESECFTTVDHGDLFSYISDSNTGFKVAVYVPKSVVLSGTRKIEWGLLVVCLLVLGMAIFVSNIFAKRFTRPIKKISSYMKEFDETRMGNYIEIHTSTELDTIGNSYNHMIDRVADLMDEVKFREKELRKSEVESLIYQIQPHFLYNTLDAIYMLARLSKEEKIMSMIYSLSKMFHINLSKGAEEIPIEKELEHVQAYMEIQRIRNEDLFQYEIICDETVKNMYVIKLILQPLVENSIRHGFKNIRQDGYIKIQVEKSGAGVHITVSNNGDVITQEKMDYINQLENRPVEEITNLFPQSESGYGIGNVVKRLRLKYEEQTRFYFEAEDGWTVCHIEIPANEGRVEDEKE